MSISFYQKNMRRVRRIRESIPDGLARVASAIISRLARPMAHREFSSYGNGNNRARLPFAAQPWALKVGDQMVNGDFVLEPPREGGNGSVILKVTGGWKGHEIAVPSRIPIAIWPSLNS